MSHEGARRFVAALFNDPFDGLRNLVRKPDAVRFCRLSWPGFTDFCGTMRTAWTGAGVFAIIRNSPPRDMPPAQPDNAPDVSQQRFHRQNLIQESHDSGVADVQGDRWLPVRASSPCNPRREKQGLLKRSSGTEGGFVIRNGDAAALRQLLAKDPSSVAGKFLPPSVSASTLGDALGKSAATDVQSALSEITPDECS